MLIVYIGAGAGAVPARHAWHVMTCQACPASMGPPTYILDMILCFKNRFWTTESTNVVLKMLKFTTHMLKSIYVQRITV